MESPSCPHRAEEACSRLQATKRRLRRPALPEEWREGESARQEQAPGNADMSLEVGEQQPRSGKPCRAPRRQPRTD